MINYNDRNVSQAELNLASANNSLTGFTIALSGKGGTGKTTLAAIFLKVITDKEMGSCLAIDADPNSNLGELLGISFKPSIGELIDRIAKNPGLVPAGMSKIQFIELQIEHAISESSNIDLLSMGRPEGPGCYCYANNALRDIVSRIIKQYKFCIIDNEAGMEHLSRRTTRQADIFAVVSDTTVVGMRSAVRIRQLIDELEFKFKKVFLFINKTQGEFSLVDELKNLKFESILEFPFDKAVMDLSVKGEPVIKINRESKLVKQTEEFLNTYAIGSN